MLAIIIGVLLIAGGFGWIVLGLLAAGMASRHVTRWESIWFPGLGLIPVVLGVVIMVWG